LGEANSNQGIPGVGSAVRRGIFKGTASRRRMEMAKAKRRIQNMSRAMLNLMP